ncbi:hypothetical protein M8J77_022376 [Diaphorina citri]|nr:hypothetical protein M8J77_022376 [Diaphorina citri]
MKLFTIHPSDNSDLESEDDDAWCTTTDTSIHSDLGSYLEDIALHDGDMSDIYDSDEFSDDDHYDDEDLSEEETEDEDESKHDLSEDSKQNSLQDLSEVSKGEDQGEVSKSDSSDTSYSTESELSDAEMFELEDHEETKPGATLYNENKDYCERTEKLMC